MSSASESNKPKNVEEYIEKYRAAVEANPECGNSRYNLAVGLLGQRKFEEAEAELYAAVENSPTLAEAYVQLGGICLHKGDLDGCLKFNKQAIQARAGFAEGYANIAFVLLQQGHVDDAIKNLQKAIAYNGNFIQAYATLANAYLQQGLVDESIKANEKALSIEPTFSVAHNNLAIAHMEKGDFAAAIEHADKAVELGYEVAPQILDELAGHR